jgi:hypothetical protein
MKTVFKLMLFSFMINLAVGIMTNALPAIGNNPQYNPMEYDSKTVNNFVGQMNATIKPGEDLTDNTNIFYRVLDKIGLGVAEKFLNAMDTLLFGFINLIMKLMGVENLWLYVFLKSMVVVGYAFGAIWLWTGKDIGRG